jgi:hypothetical protein
MLKACISLILAISIAPAASAEQGLTNDLQWRSVGPSIMGGRIDDLAVVESNPDIIYLAPASSGLGNRPTAARRGCRSSVTSARPRSEMSRWRRPTRTGVDIYRKDPAVIFATIEHKEGGLFKSEDRGKTWKKMNSFNPRPLYFSQIRIDPQDDTRIYVLGVSLYVSNAWSCRSTIIARTATRRTSMAATMAEPRGRRLGMGFPKARCGRSSKTLETRV